MVTLLIGQTFRVTRSGLPAATDFWGVCNIVGRGSALGQSRNAGAGRSARDGVLDVTFPEGEWDVAGLVITSRAPRPAPAPRRWPKALPRPAMMHVPLKSVAAGKPLLLTLKVWPINNVTTVRLHYRPVNQLAKFKTLEAPVSKASFAIPAEEISSRWDLMYYFEVLNLERSGWFEPDPDRATPYYVVKVEPAQ